MLVTAFEVVVRGPRQTRFVPQHRSLAAAGFEPYVEDVHLLAKFRAEALGALGAGGKNLFGGVLVPGVGPLARKESDDSFVHRLVVQELLAVFATEDRDWHTPNPLARDAPVRARSNHVRDAFFAPRGVPLYFADFFERPATKRSTGQRAFHRD